MWRLSRNGLAHCCAKETSHQCGTILFSHVESDAKVGPGRLYRILNSLFDPGRKFVMNNPARIKESNEHRFNFQFCRSNFTRSPSALPRHSAVWRLVDRLYWKYHESLPVKTLFQKFSCMSAHLIKLRKAPHGTLPAFSLTNAERTSYTPFYYWEHREKCSKLFLHRCLVFLTTFLNYNSSITK